MTTSTPGSNPHQVRTAGRITRRVWLRYRLHACDCRCARCQAERERLR